jgi:hypothetical protein
MTISYYSFVINRLTTLNETTITAAWNRRIACARPTTYSCGCHLSPECRHFIGCTLLWQRNYMFNDFKLNPKLFRYWMSDQNFNDLVQSCCTMSYNNWTCPLLRHHILGYHLIHANSTNWAEMICVHIRWKTFDSSSSFVFGYVI